MQAYSNPKREDEATALPDLEVFEHRCGRKRDYCMGDAADRDGENCPGPGYYYWFCFPGCMPDSEPVGPFETETEALADARKGLED